MFTTDRYTLLEITFTFLHAYHRVSDVAFLAINILNVLLDGISEVLILAVVARTVHQLLFGDIKIVVGKNRLLRGLGVVALVITSLNLAAVFALITVYIAYIIQDKEFKAMWFMRGAATSYLAGYLTFTICLFIMAVVGWAKKRTRTKVSKTQNCLVLLAEHEN